MNHASDFAATLVIRCGVMLGCLLPGVSLYAQGTQQDKATPPGAAQRDAVASGSPSDLDPSADSMRALIQRYVSDRANLSRFHAVRGSTRRAQQLESFYEDWLTRLAEVEFDQLCQDGRVDYLLLKNELQHELRSLAEETVRNVEIQPLIPFAEKIIELQESRRRLDDVQPRQAAEQLVGISAQIATQQSAIRAKTLTADNLVAIRAARAVDNLLRTLNRWHGFYDGYDPQFSWWTKAPHQQVAADLKQYAADLREKLGGLAADDRDKIVGQPIGREALLSELAYEMIAYTPEELLEIARRELDWCQQELRRASQELGFDDDWGKALEQVKTLHVGPGEQPQLITKLAREAISFLDERDLVTIPQLCRETWRMEMMSPERQRVSPYFLGGEVISVSYPTADMAHADKLMSMRGNNIHFARATVHHELIPGHHLQSFMARRYRPHRGTFRTPFLVEGWALYWEMLLWDLQFPQTPEDRIGMLFWRSHRCARIIFSLKFHLEEMSPEEAVDFLVANVGHERRNATAEVRRSVEGNYGPLYQAAYMLGGLQLRTLQRELVQSGQLTNRQFHDRILKENSIPIEMIRASLTGRQLSRDHQPGWRFYDLTDASQQ